MRVVIQLAQYLDERGLLTADDLETLKAFGMHFDTYYPGDETRLPDVNTWLRDFADPATLPPPDDRWYRAQDDIELSDYRARRPPTHSRWGRRPKP